MPKKPPILREALEDRAHEHANDELGQSLRRAFRHAMQGGSLDHEDILDQLDAYGLNSERVAQWAEGIAKRNEVTLDDLSKLALIFNYQIHLDFKRQRPEAIKNSETQDETTMDLLEDDDLTPVRSRPKRTDLYNLK